MHRQCVNCVCEDLSSLAFLSASCLFLRSVFSASAAPSSVPGAGDDDGDDGDGDDGDGDGDDGDDDDDGGGGDDDDNAEAALSFCVSAQRFSRSCARSNIATRRKSLTNSKPCKIPFGEMGGLAQQLDTGRTTLEVRA
eukprot:6201997-Pleurochrysis_carterae.AAC.4